MWLSLELVVSNRVLLPPLSWPPLLFAGAGVEPTASQMLGRQMLGHGTIAASSLPQ